MKVFVPPCWRIEIFSARSGQLECELVIGLERSGGEVSRFETLVYPERHPDFESNLPYVERIVKFLLWQRGGHTVYIGGPKSDRGSYSLCIFMRAEHANLIPILWAGWFTKGSFPSSPPLWMKCPLHARPENCLAAI